MRKLSLKRNVHVARCHNVCGYVATAKPLLHTHKRGLKRTMTTTHPLGTILIVDDTPANLDVLSSLLISHGYDVRAAINGQMALMAVEASPPDLILLDITMPGMNGYEVCEHLKTSQHVCAIQGRPGLQSQVCDIPVIFISASNETFDKVKAFQVGGVDYVTKPFQIEEVLVRITHQLTLYRQRLELQERYLEIQHLQNIVRQYLSRRAWESIEESNETRTEQVAHRRETLTIFMSDVQGFTRLSEEIDPDLLLADLSLYMNLLSTLVYEHDGEVDKFLGDGMLAFFTSPRKAMKAAFAIQRALNTFNERQRASYRSPLPTRIGLATGNVIMARIGSDVRKEYTLIGDRVNVAARLQAAASVGGVLIDTTTYEASGCKLFAAPLSLTLKGKMEPEHVYAVAYDDIASMHDKECDDA